MASLVTRLARAKPSLRLLAPLNAALSPKPLPQIAAPSQTLVPRFSFDSPPRSSPIAFPSFPIGYGFTKPLGSESEEPGTVWADSTKQKRKKKMNKHKVQKRRKLLRRKSRT